MCPAVAYEMLVSHSPPVFSHSPPTSFLSDFAQHHCRGGADTFPRTTRHFYRSLTPTLPFRTIPKRPCLVIRPEDPQSSPSLPEDPTSPTRLKKRVVFADDKGMSLTHVRVMTEPSNVPPLWSFRFLAEVTQGMSAEPEARTEPWEIEFPQPASDYIDFRKRLDTARVSLENVIVKEHEDVVVGTVKVANLSFHKEVVVRVSADNWKSFEDAFCNYVPSAAAGTSPAYVLFDTFSFKIAIPPRTKRIEFCVCFRCDGHEYWDNNGGKNYVISKKMSGLHKSLSADSLMNNHNRAKTGHKVQDVARTKMDSWSEFASWTHLENSTPYW